MMYLKSVYLKHWKSNPNKQIVIASIHVAKFTKGQILGPQKGNRKVNPNEDKEEVITIDTKKSFKTQEIVDKCQRRKFREGKSRK